nr:hypothetical protein [Tanacetum cinerariifolium]
VVTAASEIVTDAGTIIFVVEPQVTATTITVAHVIVAIASTKRRKGVVIRDPEEELTTFSIIPADTKSKDKGKGIMVEEPKPLKKKQQVEMDEECARKLHDELNKDIDWDAAIDHVKQKKLKRIHLFKERRYPLSRFTLDQMMNAVRLRVEKESEMSLELLRKLHEELNKYIDWDKAIDHVKLKAKEDPSVKRYQAMKRKPQTRAQTRKNMMMYLKNVVGSDWITLKECPMMIYVQYLRLKKAAKRRRLNEEVEDLKRHLDIVPNEDDDVYTEATPLARKVPVVDYKIIDLNNKPHYKIIRADGTHQLY